jgi:hypothetical protein
LVVGAGAVVALQVRWRLAQAQLPQSFKVRTMRGHIQEFSHSEISPTNPRNSAEPARAGWCTGSYTSLEYFSRLLRHRSSRKPAFTIAARFSILPLGR